MPQTTALRKATAWLLMLGLLWPAFATATPVAESPVAVEQDAVPALSWKEAAILGVVEGVTEFLPVSSTGHLILVNAWLGLDADRPAHDARGKPIQYADADGQPVAYTIQDAAAAYVIVIQGGAILAVAWLYRRRVWSMGRGLAGKDREGLLLCRNLLLAFLPAAVFGLLLDAWIEAHLFSPEAVAVALFVGGLVMLGVESWRRRRAPAGNPEGPELAELGVRQCLFIGCLQCLAMWPGTSRSMVTMVGGYLVGLNPVRAAEFSFLLGLLTLTAASGYRLLTDGEKMLRALDTGPVLFGILVAAVAAVLSVRWLIGWLSRHGLTLFAWYRIALALVVYLVLVRA